MPLWALSPCSLDVRQLCQIGWWGIASHSIVTLASRYHHKGDNIWSACLLFLDLSNPPLSDADCIGRKLSRKCRHFLCRQKLILKTSIRVFPTRRNDTPTCCRHHAVLGFFLCVVFCVVSSIADMSIRAVEMS
jgi:hypothetical protein